MAQTTTSSTTHSIVKYSSCKTPLTNVAKDIQWKHHENGHDQLRLTLSVVATHASTQTAVALGGQSLARHHLKIAYLSDDTEDTQNMSQNANNEVVFESLDLTSFSEIRYNSRELPLKAVHKSRSVAVRYLYPMIQDSSSLQTYRRFQVTFKTEEDAKSFIDAIQFVCPCSVAKAKHPAESQAIQPPAPRLNRQVTEVPATQRVAKAPARRAPPTRPAPASQISNPPLPRNATTYRKSTMFADVLSSSSLGEAGSSQSNGGSSVDMSRPTVGGVSFREPARVDESRDDRMEVDEPVDDGPALTQIRPSTGSSAPQNNSLVGSVDPSPMQSVLTSTAPARTVQTSAVRNGQPPAGRPGSAERDGTAEVVPATLLSAIRQADSELYNLSSAELKLLVIEVIREPGFPELVGRVHKVLKEIEQAGGQLAP